MRYARIAFLHFSRQCGVVHPFFFTVHKIWIIIVDSTHCFPFFHFHCRELSSPRNVFNFRRFFSEAASIIPKPVALNICKMVYLHDSTVMGPRLTFTASQFNSQRVQFHFSFVYFVRMENCNFHIVPRYAIHSNFGARLSTERLLAFRQTETRICLERIVPIGGANDAKWPNENNEKERESGARGAFLSFRWKFLHWATH